MPGNCSFQTPSCLQLSAEWGEPWFARLITIREFFVSDRL